MPNRFWIPKAKAIQDAMKHGLPIPGTGVTRYASDGYAKKNSGSGHRNRNRSRAQADFKEYGIKNKLGRVIPHEGW